MSTRCQIGFYNEGEKNLEEWQALIYRHTDGHPKSVLFDIIPILEDVREIMGFYDIEYTSAYLVSELKTDFKNIGISKEFHTDIDYFYAVYPDMILVYQCRYGQPHTEWKLLKTIALGSERK